MSELTSTVVAWKPSEVPALFDWREQPISVGTVVVWRGSTSQWRIGRVTAIRRDPDLNGYSDLVLDIDWSEQSSKHGSSSGKARGVQPYNVTVWPHGLPYSAALADILAERARQDAKWGEQNHPDGTSGRNFSKHADAARHSCQEAARSGSLTWFHVAREEFWEAMAETDEEKLRAELVQNAAVFLAWIECIDRRKAATS